MHVLGLWYCVLWLWWNSQEKVLHDFVIVLTVTVRQEAGGKHYDGVHSVAIVAWMRSNRWKQRGKKHCQLDPVALLSRALLLSATFSVLSVCSSASRALLLSLFCLPVSAFCIRPFSSSFLSRWMQSPSIHHRIHIRVCLAQTTQCFIIILIFYNDRSHNPIGCPMADVFILTRELNFSLSVQ